MTQPEFHISLSPIDEKHFGYKTASAAYVRSENVPEMLEYCRSNAVELLIARCSAVDLDAVQRMESEGFQLMDTLVYHRLWLGKASPFPNRGGFDFRAVEAGEEEQVREIARLAFQGYFGHYHADSRLDKGKCDDVYADWAYQACLNRSPTKDVLVFFKGDTLVAFVIVEINADNDGIPSLTGIHPDYQGLGIYATIAFGAWMWFKDRGVLYSIASTQLTNFIQQKYFNRFGYKPLNAVYTLHKWFDHQGS